MASHGFPFIKIASQAAEEKIREINDAYETLSNPFKRAQYDNQLVALERKAQGFRLDTTQIKPRMSIPKEFMLSPLGYPDKRLGEEKAQDCLL